MPKTLNSPAESRVRNIVRWRGLTPGSCDEAHYAILRITPSDTDTWMIRCHLSLLMGRDKLRIVDVARRTGLNRSTVAALFKETATRIDVAAIDELCRLFNCKVGDLFEHLPDNSESRR